MWGQCGLQGTWEWPGQENPFTLRLAATQTDQGGRTESQGWRGQCGAEETIGGGSGGAEEMFEAVGQCTGVRVDWQGRNLGVKGMVRGGGAGAIQVVEWAAAWQLAIHLLFPLTFLNLPPSTPAPLPMLSFPWPPYTLHLFPHLPYLPPPHLCLTSLSLVVVFKTKKLLVCLKSTLYFNVYRTGAY